jgi:hypothetical protein
MWWGFSPVRQGVDGDDGSNFPLVAAADQPFRRWKKGSTSVAASYNYGKIGRPFSVQTKAYIRRRRWDDARGANGLSWRGLVSAPRHPCLFGPHGSSRVLSPVKLLLMTKYWHCKNPRSNCGPEGPRNNKIWKEEIFCLLKIKYQGRDFVGKSRKSSKNAWIMNDANNNINDGV